MSIDFRLITLLIAVVIGSILLGGGMYETLLVDRVWPKNPAIIQPARGGISRGLFWTTVHPPYELALLVSLWLNWGFHPARLWVIAALVVHVAARSWSFIYFIPRAIRFEKMGDLTAEQQQQANRWVRFSRLRPLIELVSIIALCAAILVEASNLTAFR